LNSSFCWDVIASPWQTVQTYVSLIVAQSITAYDYHIISHHIISYHLHLLCSRIGSSLCLSSTTNRW